jgi:hypothetical protein
MKFASVVTSCDAAGRNYDASERNLPARSGCATGAAGGREEHGNDPKILR